MKKLFYLLLMGYSLLGLAQEQKIDANALREMSLEDLLEVRIHTASKIAEKLGEVPASVVLLTRRDIQRYGYMSLTEILQHVAGVYEIDYYGPGGPVHGIRGYVSTSASNRNIVILVNGVNQLFDYDASYSLPAIPVPVEAVDRIEIIRGPLSVVYGSGAFFGAINIITNETAQASGFATRLSVLNGSRKSRRLTGRTSYVHPKGQLVINASTYQTIGLNIPYSQLESKPLGLEAGMDTEKRLENQEVYVDLSANYQDFTVDLTHGKSDREGFITQPTSQEGTLRSIANTHLRLGYQKAFSPQVSVTGKLTYMKTEVDITYDGVIVPNSWGMQNMRNTAYEGELNLRWQPQQTFDLSSGLYYRHVPKLSTYIDIPVLPVPSLHQATQRLQADQEIATWAVFSQLNYSLNPQWKWIAGLRLEQTLGYTVFAEFGKNPAEYQRFDPHYDDQDIAVIPRLAAIYTPNEKHVFKWLYGKAINSPSFGQNTSTRLTSDLPKLEAEEIETLEFDYLTYLSPKYLLSVNLFHNRLQNLLTRVMTLTSTGQYTSFLGNGGEWTTNGVELSLQAQPTDDLQLELSANYQRTQDRQYSERNAPYSPHWLGQFKISYQWTPQATVGLTSYYVSRMESYFDPSLKNSEGSLGRRIGSATGDYLVINTNLRYENGLGQGTFVNVHVYNLFNQEIHYPTYTINSWADKGTLGWERSVMVTVGYEF